MKWVVMLLNPRSQVVQNHGQQKQSNYYGQESSNVVVPQLPITYKEATIRPDKKKRGVQLLWIRTKIFCYTVDDIMREMSEFSWRQEDSWDTARLVAQGLTQQYGANWTAIMDLGILRWVSEFFKRQPKRIVTVLLSLNSRSQPNPTHYA